MSSKPDNNSASSAANSAVRNVASAPAVFVQGSTLRHVLVMTGTGSIGLVSIFVVDALNLLYISWLGKPELTAAVGYASTVAWFFIAIGIGLSIATTALVSRKVGSGDRESAKKTAAAALLLVVLTIAALCVVAAPFLGNLLTLLGAKGATHVYAHRFLLITIPSIPLLGMGMSLGGILRSLGDAKRGMLVTLLPAIVLAAFDPILIFWLGLELDGAAIAVVIARFCMVAIGGGVLFYFHQFLTTPSKAHSLSLLKPFFAIGLPALMTQIASPIGNAMVTRAMSGYGDEAVSGWAVISRLTPMAFGIIFALSGSIGAIIGQNYGAKRFDRVRSTILDSLKVTVVVCVIVCVLLAILSSIIADAFGAKGVGREVLVFFCIFSAWGFIFQGVMFVANAAFNTLGFALYSTWLNWARVTVGVVPFVWLGGQWYGAKGVIAGYSLGGVVFGLVSLGFCFKVLRNLKAKELAIDSNRTVVVS